MLRILEWKQLFIQPENQGLADYLNLFSVEQSNSYIVWFMVLKAGKSKNAALALAQNLVRTLLL